MLCGTVTAAGAQPLPAGIPTSTVTVKTSVTFDPASGIFQYSYTLTNSPQSVGQIFSFDLNLSNSSGGAPLSSDGLTNTATGYSGLGDFPTVSGMIPVGFKSQPVGWDSGPTVHQTATWFSGSIPPGQSQGPFVLTSHAPPGIRTFVAKPLYEPSDFIKQGIDDPGVSYDDAQKIVDLDKAIQATIQSQGFTVGPVQPASLTNPSQLIDSLIAAKHQAANLGWLGGKDFIDDLDKQLSEAKQALSRQQDSEAPERIRKFIDMLQQQHREQSERHRDDRHEGREHHDDHERFLSSEAYQLLEVNAEVILSQLPAPHKQQRGDDDEHRDGGHQDDGR
ncbi:MAG TPA: hypothetical protein VN915_01615 [Elusimicrobiota bacterium]|nr:hypothetical protein [Elusimicrobiota bacterium]